MKTYKTVCTKESTSVNIVVNEYTENPAPGNGNDLLCDFLMDEEVMRFATVEKNHCGVKAEEQIDKLKQERLFLPSAGTGTRTIDNHIINKEDKFNCLLFSAVPLENNGIETEQIVHIQRKPNRKYQ